MGDFAGACRHDAYSVLRDAQTFRRNLPDLGVQPLAHFGAAMVHLDAAILIYKDQRPGLVEHGGSKRDTELYRCDGQSAFVMRRSRVEALDCLASRRKVAG